MPRNFFTFLFGATLLVAIFMTGHAQPGDEILPATTRPPAIKPSKPTIRPNLPTRRPKPTRRPTPPTRRTKPTRRTTLPTRRTKPTRITTKTTTRRSKPSWWITRIPRAVKTPRPKKCPREPKKCGSAGPSLCIRSRNGKLCRRVANKCALRNLNCNAKPRNNWSISIQKRCAKLRVGGKAGKCKN